MFEKDTYLDEGDNIDAMKARLEESKRNARTHTIYIYFEDVAEPVAVKRVPIGAAVDAVHFCKATCVTKVVIEDDKGARFTVRKGHL